MMMNRASNESLIGLEVKLTALPDNTTKKLSEENYSCELVVRPPTICFLACSICEQFQSDEDKIFLRRILNTVPKINHWGEVSEVLPHYMRIESAIAEVAKQISARQSPLIVQPVWKMKDGKLADDCLDHSYGNANDKAFAIPGKSSWRLLNSPELTHPRIGKNEIRNIILGGGQNLLSPERRFDAVIVNSPDLFD